MDKQDLLRSPFVILASGFYSGLSPIAPGTVGCLVGLVLYWFLSHMPTLLYLITCITFVFLSVWISDRAAFILRHPDPPMVVIDEIAGYLVTMAGVPGTWQDVVIGFLLFRALDIIKPFPARQIDRTIPGGWGIVFDDVIAGLYGCVMLHVVLRWM